MPKKFAGENSKSVAARARKSAAKDADVAKKQKEAEDAYWKDDDKHIAKKMQKKQESEQKKQQVLQKKAEAKALLEKELSTINTAPKQPAAKITRAQIQAENEKRNAAVNQVVAKTAKPKTHVEQPLEENINRLQPEEVANTIDEALKMLRFLLKSGTSTVQNSRFTVLCYDGLEGSGVTDNSTPEDIHPEKRLKAAYLAFEEKHLPRLKQENPSLRMSQLKQMLFKEWTKSSENPLNKGQ